ncbi:MAG: type II toxin-antitoxin system VapC family toxin [Thermoanaerobaculia bacterium]
MIVLDTHAWIWWIAVPRRLSQRARRAIEEAKDLAVSAISLWEVAMLVAKSRLELDRDVGLWMRQALAAPRIRLAPLSVEIAVRSTALGRDFQGDPADRLIAATVLELDAALVTKDDRMRSWKRIVTIW